MGLVVIDDIQFNPHINYGCKHTVAFFNTVTIGQTGVEQRFGQRTRSQRSYSFNDDMDRDDVAYIKEFFEARLGNLYGFRWKDWSEYKVIAEEIEFTAEVAQLTKLYDDPIRPVTRKILKPIANTFILYLDAVVVPDTDYTLDDTTGIVTLDDPPEVGTYTFTVEFDVPARFLNQEFDFTHENMNMFDLRGLGVIELMDGEDE